MADNEAIKAEQATDTGNASTPERPLLDVRNLKTSFFTHVGERFPSLAYSPEE